MKSIYIMRHAKACNKYNNINDFDRPLNEEGILKAHNKGIFLKSKHIKPDLILSSTASRAVATAMIISENISYPYHSIKLDHELYLCNEYTLLDYLKDIENSYKQVMIIGHNPGLYNLAFKLSKDHTDLLKLPTSGIIGLRFNMEHWNKIVPASGELFLLNFD